MPYLVWKKKFDRQKGFLALRQKRFFSIKPIGVFKTEKENYIRRLPFYAITGGVGTGKTRELKKLARWSNNLFGTEGVYLNAKEGLDNWYKRAGLSNEDLRGLKQFEKNELLIERLKGRAVFIDDLDGVNNKVKVSLLKELIKNSRGGAVAFENVKRVHPAIIQTLRAKQRLKTKEDLRVIDLGRSEEIVDVGMVVAIVLIFGLALIWGFSEALLLALGFRLFVRYGEKA